MKINISMHKSEYQIAIIENKNGCYGIMSSFTVIYATLTNAGYKLNTIYAVLMLNILHKHYFHSFVYNIKLIFSNV